MARVIAVAGKGGTGKTTVAGLLVRALRQDGRGPILAVDADSNSCLDVAIGLTANRTVSDVLDESRGLRDVPQNMPKPTYVEYQLEDCLAEGRGVDLIVMGRPEGQECCLLGQPDAAHVHGPHDRELPRRSSSTTRRAWSTSARTTKDIDLLLVVSDASLAGARASRRIAELVGSSSCRSNASRSSSTAPRRWLRRWRRS